MSSFLAAASSRARRGASPPRGEEGHPGPGARSSSPLRANREVDAIAARIARLQAEEEEGSVASYATAASGFGGSGGGDHGEFNVFSYVDDVMGVVGGVGVRSRSVASEVRPVDSGGEAVETDIRMVYDGTSSGLRPFRHAADRLSRRMGNAAGWEGGFNVRELAQINNWSGVRGEADPRRIYHQGATEPRMLYHPRRPRMGFHLSAVEAVRALRPGRRELGGVEIDEGYQMLPMGGGVLPPGEEERPGGGLARRVRRFLDLLEIVSFIWKSGNIQIRHKVYLTGAAIVWVLQHRG